jgi:peptide/nickel transport system permease protein
MAELPIPATLAARRRRAWRARSRPLSIILFGLIVAACILAPLIDHHSPITPDPANAFAPASAQHWLGTDELGRDLFREFLSGAHISLLVGLAATAISMVLGAGLGIASGYYGGWIDNLLMRVTDLFLIVPALAVLLVAAKYLGHGSPVRLAMILGLLFWTTIARIVRGSFLSLKEKEYVEAAKASGSGNFRIMFRHILPNTIGPIVVAATLLTGLAILTESTISFVGFGLDLSLGTLIAEGQAAGLNLWWLVTMPGLTIVLIILCVNFIGDGLRDALDPTQRRVRA